MTDDDDTKRCSKCWQYLPLTDFDEDRRTRDRLSYRCHDCRTEHGAYGDKAGQS